VLITAGLIVALGALVQGTVGYGMALVAAPLLALAEPTYLPVPLILLTSAHAVLAAVRAVPGGSGTTGPRHHRGYFVLGSVISLAALAAAGQVTGESLGRTAALAPFLLIGFALSGPARRVLDNGWTRRAVLSVAAASAAYCSDAWHSPADNPQHDNAAGAPYRRPCRCAAARGRSANPQR
jgi:hypothetical protein